MIRADRAVIGVACVGMFMTQLDLTITNVAIGSVQHQFHVPTATVTWIVDGYMVSFAACLLGIGDLADLYGRKRAYLLAMTAFTTASAGCGLAASIGWLIALRAVQGVAAAGVMVTSLAVLLDWFPAEQRPRAIGWWASVAGSALVFGPLLGGFIIDDLGWRWVFWLNLPVGLCGIAAGRRLIRESYGPPRRLDWHGQSLGFAALAALAWGIEEGTSNHWTGPYVAMALGAGLMLAAAFIAAEHRSSDPLIPLRLFRSATFTGANLAGFLTNFGTLGLLFLLSVYFEQVSGDSARGTGLRIVPLFAAYMLTSPLGGRLVARFGAPITAAAGCAISAVATGLLPGVIVLRASGAMALVAALVLCGAGLGGSLAGLVALAVGSVTPGRAGLASGVNNTSRQIGNAIGVALLGGLVASAVTPRRGVLLGLWIVAAAYLLAALLAITVIRTNLVGPAAKRGQSRRTPARTRE